MTTVADKAIAESSIANIIDQTDLSCFGNGSRQEINDHRTSLGLAPLPEEPAPGTAEPPDNPSCDACGKPYSANLICARCKLAFYCSKDCQRHAWKKEGHKQDCDAMRDRCHAMAKMVVDQKMSNQEMPPILRVQNLEHLDQEGPYMCAQELGLHGLLYEMLQEDKRDVQKRYQSNSRIQHTSFCVWIVTTLFRGGRNSRRELGVDTTRECDVKRVKDFLYSKEDAFELWWDTSVAFVLDVVMDKKVFHNKPLHMEAHQVGRNILATWSQILTPPKAAKAILFGKHRSTLDHQKAKARAIFVAESTKKTLLGLNEKRDFRGVLEARMNQNLAMMAYWCREFGVDVNMEELVGLKGVKLQLYRQMAVPIGEGTIRKGFGLTNQECQEAMRAPHQR